MLVLLWCSHIPVCLLSTVCTPHKSRWTVKSRYRVALATGEIESRFAPCCACPAVKVLACLLIMIVLRLNFGRGTPLARLLDCIVGLCVPSDRDCENVGPHER